MGRLTPAKVGGVSWTGEQHKGSDNDLAEFCDHVRGPRRDGLGAAGGGAAVERDSSADRQGGGAPTLSGGFPHRCDRRAPARQWRRARIHGSDEGRRHGGLLLGGARSEEHTSELQSQSNLVCRLLLEKKKQLPIFCSDIIKVSARTGRVIAA